jgi:hypothetical protein
MATLKQPINEVPPLCSCGCEVQTKWMPGKGWAKWCKGHHLRDKPSPRRSGCYVSPETRQKMSDSHLLYYAKKYRPGRVAPEGSIAPFCSCGCGTLMQWNAWKGYGKWCPGHNNKGKPSTRLGVTITEETRYRMSKARSAYYEGIRRRDIDPTGPGVYSTNEYKEARYQLVEGNPCSKCGSEEKIHAHHVIPGDDSSLIPLCKSCHASLHHGDENTKPKNSPIGETAPLCACGCGRPVKWKRVRGWAQFCKGHGTSKIPCNIHTQEAPLCKCGCGETTKFRHGKGWGEYKRGHGQRIYGHYSEKPKAQMTIIPKEPIPELPK